MRLVNEPTKKIFPLIFHFLLSTVQDELFLASSCISCKTKHINVDTTYVLIESVVLYKDLSFYAVFRKIRE